MDLAASVRLGKRAADFDGMAEGVIRGEWARSEMLGE